MQIDLPNDLSTRLKQIAKSTRKPINELAVAYLRDSLDDPLKQLPINDQKELKAFRLLSNETLLTIAREKFQDESVNRLQNLMTRHNLGNLSADELAELEQLVHRSDQLMVRKAEAIALLNNRGHTYTFSNIN